MKRCDGRRGAVFVSVAVMLVVLLGFAALTIDVGYLQIVRTQCQAAADAAAMAAAPSLLDASSVFGTASGDDRLHAVRDRAVAYGALNLITGKPCLLRDNIVNDPSGDVVCGTASSVSSASLEYADPATYNAVTVTARRTDGHPNGSVPVFFAGILGIRSAQTAAAATAMVDSNFAGIRASDSGSPLTPFAIKVGTWEDEVVNGTDEFGYSGDAGIIRHGDDIPEVRLYVANGAGSGKKKGGAADPCDGAPGNYGLLNVGNGSNGVPTLRRQIIDGISSDDLVSLTGEPMIRMFDEGGAGRTYRIGGDPGIKAGIESAVEARLGDVIGFFLYDCLTSQGSNAEYRIVEIAFGRVMDVELHGPDKRITIQPETYVGTAVVTDASAPSSPFAGRVILIR